MSSTILESITTSQYAPGLDSFLHVERTDISFANRRPDLVDIRIRVTNTGIEPSEPTQAILSAAPLGAFVPWRPLAVVPVPGLEPGESFVVRAEARQPRQRPLGTPDRVPPRDLLVALGADDNDSPPRRRRSRVAEILAPFSRHRERSVPDDATGLDAGELPADPFELLARGNPHWAGNLNIFIGGQAVERHLAQALRVYPGRPNMAIFVVGSRRDAYAFHLAGAAAEWNAMLLDLTRARSFLPTCRGPVVPLDQWVEMSGHQMMILALNPPVDCTRQSVEVHVKQRSTQETAIVEFSLDPAAAGPGCYVV